MTGLQPGHLTVQLAGSAGQSLGAFAVQGLRLEVTGEANDYVGKGLSGGTIVVRPARRGCRWPAGQRHHRQHRALRRDGRTAVRAGLAGERFAVRNSGAEAVVEGCGANGCEYMTGGMAVILGPVGDNFARRHDRRHGLRLRPGRTGSRRRSTPRAWSPAASPRPIGRGC